MLSGVPDYPEGKFFPGYGIFKRRQEDYQGIKIRRVPLVPRGQGGKLRLTLNFLSFALCGCLLAPMYCPGSFDLILVFETSPVTVGLPALVLKRLRNIPIMFWVQDLWPESLSATGAVSSSLLLGLVGLFGAADLSRQRSHSGAVPGLFSFHREVWRLKAKKSSIFPTAPKTFTGR